MKVEEYIKTVAYNGHMINIGNDDAGQQYFLEYVDENGELVEVGCGTYNSDYQYEIERLFGTPSMCVQYGKHTNDHTTCEHQHAHGYCGRCEYNSKNRGVKQ